MRVGQGEWEESGQEAREEGLELYVLPAHTDLGSCSSASARSL